ncbi:MAG: TraB/GumN family protein [Pseudomonadota bacterium]
MHNKKLIDQRASDRLLLFVLWAFCAVALLVPSGTLAQESVPSGTNAPAMWRVYDNDSVIYLFGTFHILPENVQWRTGAYQRAMADSDITIVETDLEAPGTEEQMTSLVIRYGLNPPGVTLSETIGTERADRLKAVASRFGIPAENLEQQRPWLALITLSTIALQKAGFDPENGVEKYVLKQAKSEGDSFEYLETLEQQITTLANISNEDMLANFDATLDEFTDFKSFTTELLEHWRTGNVSALAQVVVGDLRRDAPTVHEAIFLNRNRNWVNRIKNLLAGSGNIFMAVGAGHLVGQDSVVNMLQQQGYTVERVQ